MDYQQTLKWMFDRLPVYQNVGKAALNYKLDNITHFCRRLGDPHHQFKSVHIAGSNGKGSSSHMLASVLQEAAYKTGLYTSPHLLDFRERIKINGAEIPVNDVISFVEAHKTYIESAGLSFFELTVGMAFDYFAKQKVDIAIIEVGLGGLLDSTNIINPMACLITNISLEHTDLLGSSLTEIAEAKAGIIKPETPVVISEYQPETIAVFRRIAKELNAPLYLPSPQTELPPCDLKGRYQPKNIRGVLETINHLKGFNISKKNIKDGLANVAKNTRFKGRWQQIQTSPKVILDTAHNAGGFEQVAKQIADEAGEQKVHLVLGFVAGKAFGDILKMLPKNAAFYFCAPNLPRALDPHILRDAALKEGISGEIYPTVPAAYKAAMASAAQEDFIYVGGSNFVVADLLAFLEK